MTCCLSMKQWIISFLSVNSWTKLKALFILCYHSLAEKFVCPLQRHFSNRPTSQRWTHELLSTAVWTRANSLNVFIELTVHSRYQKDTALCSLQHIIEESCYKKIIMELSSLASVTVLFLRLTKWLACWLLLNYTLSWMIDSLVCDSVILSVQSPFSTDTNRRTNVLVCF